MRTLWRPLSSFSFVCFLASLAVPLLSRGLVPTIHYLGVTEQNRGRHGFASLRKVETGFRTQKSCVAIVQGSHLVKTVSCFKMNSPPWGHRGGRMGRGSFWRV